VLDAKDPGESVDDIYHIGQVYSYTIHPEIRAPFFGLCNGKEFLFFHISEQSPVLRIPTSELDQHWDELHRLLGAEQFASGVETPLTTEAFYDTVVVPGPVIGVKK